MRLLAAVRGLHPSVFWRLVLGFSAIIAVLAGVNLYVLVELRQFTRLNTELVSQHYPSIETARWLVGSLYEQLKNEKQYTAVRDPDFLKSFQAEAAEFDRALRDLLMQDLSSDGRRLLGEVRRLHEQYVSLVAHKPVSRRTSRRSSPDYELKRDALIDRITNPLQSYIAWHEGEISRALEDSQVRAMRAESITPQLILIALCLGLGLAGLVSYSILRPIRRLQGHIRQIGYGNFGTPVQIEGPRDLRDLVEAVSWMRVKLQELDEMKSDFLSHVTHELRNPLTSIHTGTQLLLEEVAGPLTSDQRDMLRMMIDNSRRLIEMISTLLDLSKMDAGMMAYRLASTDLKEIAETSLNKVRLMAEGKQVRLVLESRHKPFLVPTDRMRIEQVLDNLLSNAVKFSPSGGVVRVRLDLDRTHTLARVEVSDSGPGIPPDSLPRIFDRFYQGPIVAQGVAGTGLGLALAKKVVEGHGGRIWAVSDLGKGTTVQFVLPLKARCDDESATEESQRSMEQSHEQAVSIH
ncbi:MAG TPA: HAMP domain-containing sensor histidine kinase [Nitrospiraceae bacterium]|jgi:two-component system sensor histidine kinase GlrK|nr:HAMP domain-containing sensor histidine kinase [Nitrospiraceae bacterium]